MGITPICANLYAKGKVRSGNSSLSYPIIQLSRVAECINHDTSLGNPQNHQKTTLKLSHSENPQAQENYHRSMSL